MGKHMTTSSPKPVTPSEAHVIVVEDNAGNLIVIMKLLQMAGIERLNWRTTGKEVVRFIRDMSPDETDGPDLILLDISLPGEDGFEILAALRADPLLQNTRVVAVTMHNSPAEMEQARQAGFDSFIGKPLDPKKFPNQIRQILAGEPVWAN
jgi:two-component system cell cycle response regulator DivK